MPLLLVIPAAEPLVGRWRAEHDWAARVGIPAHVTVRLPFLPPDRWRDESTRELAALVPLEVTLARLEDRPGALVVLVEPDGELRRLTEAVGGLWPELPPHKGDRPNFAYHVTVVRTQDPGVRAAATQAIAPQLPVRVTGTELWAAHGSPEDGVEHAVLGREKGTSAAPGIVLP
jgi:2'-5' RNA ligase